MVVTKLFTKGAKMMVQRNALNEAMEEKKNANVPISTSRNPFFGEKKINGVKVKCKRMIPDYIPDEDAELLAKCKKAAYRWDMGIKLPLFDYQIGWSSIIAFCIPELGDLIEALVTFWLTTRCWRVKGGLPMRHKFIMLLWNLADFFVGLIPFFGDFVDNEIRCNVRNIARTEKYLMKKYGPPGMSYKALDEARMVPVDEKYARIDREKRMAQGSGVPQRPGTNSSTMKPPRSHSASPIRAPQPAYNGKGQPAAIAAPPKQSSRFGIPINTPQKVGQWYNEKSGHRRDRDLERGQETGLAMI